MHTVTELSRASFDYRSDGQSVTREDVLPELTLQDRVGVVMKNGISGLGAGNFLLSCVTAFYERRSEQVTDFFEYPDYFTFQTSQPADYQMLDVYPEHKNVSVEPTAESILRAINDRAISVLLVPEAAMPSQELTNEPAQSLDIMDVTLRSAERLIDHCYIYRSDGQPRDPDVSIRVPRTPTAEWYHQTARTVDLHTATGSLSAIDSGSDQIEQSFRKSSLEHALHCLPTDH